MKNNYIEINVQKGFAPGMTGTYEHTAQLAHIIWQAKKKQQSLVVVVVTLLDLKNAFSEVHHNLIPVVLDYHLFHQSLLDVLCHCTKTLLQQLLQTHMQCHSYILREAYYKVTA